MEAASESNVDYAVQARTALAAVERLSTDLDAVERKTSMCREKWRDYGSALLAQRALTPSDQEFGRWIMEHGLDAGVASSSAARSDAMWLSTHFASLSRAYTGNAHHPSTIRRQCREAGHEWAHDLPLTIQRRQESRRSKASARPYSWQRVAADEGVSVLSSGATRTDVRKRLRAIDSTEDLFEPDNEARLRAALVKLRAQEIPEAAAATVSDAREILTEPQRVRFDRAVGRATAALEGAFDAKNRALQESYEQAVRAGVEARLATSFDDERRRLAEAIARNTREMQEFIVRRDGIKLAMTKAEWKFVRGCLHSDHVPADLRARFDDAFVILSRLERYVGGDKDGP